MNNSISQYIVLLCLSFSFLYSTSYSRIKTTLDMSSNYIFNTDYLTNNLSPADLSETFDIKGGLCFAYEHSVFRTDKINGFLGAEFMMGKKSDMTMAFHSIYLMPILNFSQNSSLAFRLGYTSMIINRDYPIREGWMISVGPEFKISDIWSLSFSNTWYYITKGIVGSFPSDDVDIPDAQVDLSYDKFGVSIVYGFSKKNGEENK